MQLPTLFGPPAGADWGGSTQLSQWIGSPTSTRIPGIIWSEPAAPPQVGAPVYTSGVYASQPVGAAYRIAPEPFARSSAGGLGPLKEIERPRKPALPLAPDPIARPNPPAPAPIVPLQNSTIHQLTI